MNFRLYRGHLTYKTNKILWKLIKLIKFILIYLIKKSQTYEIQYIFVWWCYWRQSPFTQMVPGTYKIGQKDNFRTYIRYFWDLSKNWTFSWWLIIEFCRNRLLKLSVILQNDRKSRTRTRCESFNVEIDKLSRRYLWIVFKFDIFTRQARHMI